MQKQGLLIEKKACRVVEELLDDIIASNKDLVFNISSNDKTPITDGFIRYKNNEIAIQLKGTKTNSTSYKVSDSYKNYVKNNNLLFIFVAGINPDKPSDNKNITINYQFLRKGREIKPNNFTTLNHNNSHVFLNHFDNLFRDLNHAELQFLNKQQQLSKRSSELNKQEELLNKKLKELNALESSIKNKNKRLDILLDNIIKNEDKPKEITGSKYYRISYENDKVIKDKNDFINYKLGDDNFNLLKKLRFDSEYTKSLTKPIINIIDGNLIISLCKNKDNEMYHIAYVNNSVKLGMINKSINMSIYQILMLDKYNLVDNQYEFLHINTSDALMYIKELFNTNDLLVIKALNNINKYISKKYINEEFRKLISGYAKTIDNKQLDNIVKEICHV